jgi:hypothetical protein
MRPLIHHSRVNALTIAWGIHRPARFEHLVVASWEPYSKAGHGNDRVWKAWKAIKAGFPPFPHSLEIPSGLPHSHGLDDERGIQKQEQRPVITQTQAPSTARDL